MSTNVQVLKRPLGGTNIRVTPIGLGMMEFSGGRLMGSGKKPVTGRGAGGDRHPLQRHGCASRIELSHQYAGRYGGYDPWLTKNEPDARKCWRDVL